MRRIWGPRRSPARSTRRSPAREREQASRGDSRCRGRQDLKTLAKAVEPYDRAWLRGVGPQLSVTQGEMEAFEEALLKIDRAQRRRRGLFPVSKIRGRRNQLSRIIQRLNSGHGHDLFTTVIEELYIAIGIADLTKGIWDRMKTDIDYTFTNDAQAGGSAFLGELLRAWKKMPNLRVTLIGHSAGAIVSVCQWPLAPSAADCYRRRWISGSTSSITVFSLIALPSAVSRRRSSSAAVSFSPQTSATRTFFPTAARAARRIGGISPMVS